jgi:PEGA domain
MAAAVLLATLLVGLAIGIALGRATTGSVAAAPPATTDLGQLGVSSLPADGNVTVDGRFVGVAPIERLDLDPGKHSIVIDVFGFQPYAGTLAIEPRGKVNLKVLLVPIGGAGTTSGNLTGPGKATKATVPASALLPATPGVDAKSPGAAPGGTREPKRGSPPAPPRVVEPPPRPRRDCSGEQSRCRDSCSRAETDCRFSCPNCGSCPTSVGWDECNRQCNSCRGSCDQNTKFCASSCDGQYDNCQATQ